MAEVPIVWILGNEYASMLDCAVGSKPFIQITPPRLLIRTLRLGDLRYQERLNEVLPSLWATGSSSHQQLRKRIRPSL